MSAYNETSAVTAREAIQAYVTSNSTYAFSEELRDQLSKQSFIPVAMALDAIQLAHSAGIEVEAILIHVLRQQLEHWAHRQIEAPSATHSPPTPSSL